jgi:hypothetical protein
LHIDRILYIIASNWRLIQLQPNCAKDILAKRPLKIVETDLIASFEKYEDPVMKAIQSKRSGKRGSAKNLNALIDFLQSLKFFQVK